MPDGRPRAAGWMTSRFTAGRCADAMGMVALVVVDNPASNLEAAKAAQNPPKARERFDALFAELG